MSVTRKNRANQILTIALVDYTVESMARNIGAERHHNMSQDDTDMESKTTQANCTKLPRNNSQAGVENVNENRRLTCSLFTLWLLILVRKP